MSEAIREGNYALKPGPGRISVRCVDRAEMSPGGIYIPETAAPDKPSVGIVAAVCDPYLVDDLPMEPIYKVGTIVVFGRYTGTKIQVGREHFIVMKENDVLGVLYPVEDNADGLNVAAPDLSQVRVTDRA